MRYWFVVITLSAALAINAADYVPRDVVWTSQSRNSSESMPCGGHDVGMNVWVEGGDVLFYAQQSGWFDENNTLMKAGRWRLRVEGQPFGGQDFRQRLCLDEGCIYISGGGVEVRLWADVCEPVVYVAISSQQTVQAALSYESWRYRDRPVTKAECQQCSYKWVLPADCTTFADSIEVVSDGQSVGGSSPASARPAPCLRFWHQNRRETVFDFTVSREQLDAIRDSLYNPLGLLLMQGEMWAPGFRFAGTADDSYASTDYRAWTFRNDQLKHSIITITLSVGEASKLCSPAVGEASKLCGRGLVVGEASKLCGRGPIVGEASKLCIPAVGEASKLCGRLSRKAWKLRPLRSKERSARWWHEYWQRSWIVSDSGNDSLQAMLRNYELMRYMLGCNAHGRWPTKFNGGLFTFDPVYVDSAMAFTPDYRKWGGGTMTAQNQRLVYWPLLKSGDHDVLRPQIDTYYRLLPNAMARTRHYWGHGGASFTEQMENFGLPNPAEYGKHPEGTDPGVERNAWLEYQWDTALEFAHMEQLVAQRTDSCPLARECIRFFVEHYQWQAKQWSAKALDEQGRLIIYPGSACETYKMAYNPSSTIAALRAVNGAFAATSDSTAAATSSFFTLHSSLIPDLPLRVLDGDTCIAPAMAWARVQNTETPQLYPVWPWRLYGLGRPGLQTARNTYLKDPHAVAMRSAKGWKQDNIWAACLGLTGEARRLNLQKLANGPYRFPAFYDPGFDWAPDHNRGGAGMIGLQEMLLQEAPDGELILFPAWPREWDCRFRLHTLDGRTVEASISKGVIK